MPRGPPHQGRPTRPVGFEPTTFGFEVRNQDDATPNSSEGLRKSNLRLAAQGKRAARNEPPPDASTDPHLAAVVAAWSELPEAIRAGIVAMVKAASGSRPDRGAKAFGCEEGEV